jgi:hypothetical protein
MDPRDSSKRRGIRMAMQVAAITLGAGGAALAVAAEAQAEPAVEAAPRDGVKPVAPSGWSCWGGPISRGPAAPPAMSNADFERLCGEVPS